MVRSMTAFARQQIRNEFGELTWELRSVNHRYLEVAVRLPEELRMLEPSVRERLNQRLGRGKVECGLRYKPATNLGSEFRVNDVLVKQLLDAANQLMHHLHSSQLPPIMDILRWPGVLEVEERDFTPVQQAAIELFDSTLDEFIESREREGGRLAELIEQRVQGMHEQVELARQRLPQVITGVRERLLARLAEVSETLDTERLEQEMALLAQRLDVDEEMDRLTTHLGEVERVLKTDKPIGRRMDFLMQELNREANTLGSKSVDSDTTKISVEMKVLIEQMREQVQNLE